MLLRVLLFVDDDSKQQGKQQCMLLWEGGANECLRSVYRRTTNPEPQPRHHI